MSFNQPAAPTPSAPKYFFLYLLAFATLYCALTSYIVLVFQLIDSFFPAHFSILSLIDRGHIATLIITFPVYLGIMIYLKKERLRNSEISQLKIRLWLTHFTLFITVLIILSTLGCLVYSFLGDTLTLRFVLKTIALLIITAALFCYYFFDLKQPWKPLASGLWIGTIIIIVILTIAYSIYKLKTTPPIQLNTPGFARGPSYIPTPISPPSKPIPYCTAKTLKVSSSEDAVIQEVTANFAGKMACEIGTNCLNKWNDHGITKFSIAWKQQCGPVINGIYQLGDNGHGSTFVCQHYPDNRTCCWPLGYNYDQSLIICSPK